METGRTYERGDVVHLTTELRGAGRIHEIGARALVVTATRGELELEVGGDVVACSARGVAPAATARSRVRVRTGLRAATR
jgi:hypothetical protein